MEVLQNNEPGQAVTAVTQVEQERAIQEIKAQVILARHFPRDITIAREKIVSECKRPRFADLALYQYPRGKKKNKAGQWVANIVSGPSIRLAEVMARSFTNMKFGIRVMSRRNNMSDVQSYAWDMEDNVIRTMDFIVKHERKSGEKTVALTDDRDIYETEANQGSRRMRACILALIPKDIQDEAEDEVNKTMMNNLAGEAGVDRIKKMLDKFSELDITQEMIEKKFGYKLKSLKIENWAELGRIYNSLKDGIGRADDYFGDRGPGKTETKKTKEVEEELKRAAEAKEKEDKDDSTDQEAEKPISAGKEETPDKETNKTDESEDDVQTESEDFKVEESIKRELKYIRERMKELEMPLAEIHDIFNIGDLLQKFKVPSGVLADATPEILKIIKKFLVEVKADSLSK